VRDPKQLFALGAMILMVASPAAAQFTTVVAPPKKAPVVATADPRVTNPAPRDTGRRATLQEMSAWVDSVAGTSPSVAAAPQVVDSATGDVAIPAPAKTETGTQRFTDGARAPNTASPLPGILLLGLASMASGAALLVTRRREA
jgi:LPXTG-motif cell wall-anchored protein